ncbi:MAG TPA: glucose-6-phosphate dehydrogenase assembly protein OpcA [Candidatus Rhabdochlamydia sp.]|jgi:Glucose-6-phosphate dehydrogenase subunit|nr:glucose-6-phosphate dehydrogenase assembly protein OpcA [Candidatus Rhabdochlamydia sp.]
MSSAPYPVSPAQIEQELKRIWESLETKNITRACLFNLIFFTYDNPRKAYFQKVAHLVVEKFPSRVLFITIDQTSQKEELMTQVSMLFSGKAEYDVACDYIEVQSSHSSQERIPFLILPHILPDLPVYLVWAEDLGQNELLLQSLEPLANRIIFDSEATCNLSLFARYCLQHQSIHYDIADLNWARIESWRDILSAVFSSEEKLERVQQTQNLHIFYNAQQSTFFCHAKIQSLYLQAWLACQLKWEFKSLEEQKERIICTYQGKAGPIQIFIAPVVHTHLPTGLIVSIEILLKDTSSFIFSRDIEQQNHITVQETTLKQCALPARYIFPKGGAGHSLVQEICRRGNSSHYLQVLNLLQNIHLKNPC